MENYLGPAGTPGLFCVALLRLDDNMWGAGLNHHAKGALFSRCRSSHHGDVASGVVAVRGNDHYSKEGRRVLALAGPREFETDETMAADASRVECSREEDRAGEPEWSLVTQKWEMACG